MSVLPPITQAGKNTTYVLNILGERAAALVNLEGVLVNLGDAQARERRDAEAALAEGAAVKTELIRARETIKHQASSIRECSIENQKIAALVEEAHTAQLHKMTEDCAVRRRSAMHSRKTALQVDTVYLYAMLKIDSLR